MTVTALEPVAPAASIDQEQRNVLIEQHVRLVRHVVTRIASRLPSHVDKDDLMGAGMEGLLGAAARFEPDRGVAFSTFAGCSIRGSVLDALRKSDPLARPTRGRVRQIERAEAALASDWGGHVPTDALARRAGLTPAEAEDALSMRRATAHVSLDEDRAGGPLGDVICDPRARDAAATLLLEEARLALREEIDALPERDRKVMVLYYGDGLLLREVGQVLGVTEGRVSQIHKRAVERLRTALSLRGLCD